LMLFRFYYETEDRGEVYPAEYIEIFASDYTDAYNQFWEWRERQGNKFIWSWYQSVDMNWSGEK